MNSHVNQIFAGYLDMEKESGSALVGRSEEGARQKVAVTRCSAGYGVVARNTHGVDQIVAVYKTRGAAQAHAAMCRGVK